MKEEKWEKRESDRRKIILLILDATRRILGAGDNEETSVIDIADAFNQQAHNLLPGFKVKTELTVPCQLAVQKVNEIISRFQVSRNEAQSLWLSAAQWLLIDEIDLSAKNRLERITTKGQ